MPFKATGGVRDGLGSKGELSVIQSDTYAWIHDIYPATGEGDATFVSQMRKV